MLSVGVPGKEQVKRYPLHPLLQCPPDTRHRAGRWAGRRGRRGREDGSRERWKRRKSGHVGGRGAIWRGGMGRGGGGRELCSRSGHRRVSGDDVSSVF